MFETLLNTGWESLSPSLGVIALACVGVGIALGVIRKLIDQFGNIKVLIGIGAIVVVAWAVRYVTARGQVVVRVVEKKVEVEKVVPDRSSLDAMERQFEVMQKQAERLAKAANEARERAAKAEGEIERRDGEQRAREEPVNAARTEFANLFKQAKEHPRWVVEQTEEQKPQQKFTITRHDVIEGRYLVKTVYGCHVRYAGEDFAVIEGVTISVQDAHMKRVGLPAHHALHSLIDRIHVRVTGIAKSSEAKGAQYLCIDIQDITEDLASEAIKIYEYPYALSHHFNDLRRDRKIPEPSRK